VAGLASSYPVSSVPLSPTALASLLVWLERGVALALAGWTLLFLCRLVLTWYPQIDQGRSVLRAVRICTEPLLKPTRRLAAPIGGVDVTPVIWVGIVSLVREVLVGQQGLIVQLQTGVALAAASAGG